MGERIWKSIQLIKLRFIKLKAWILGDRYILNLWWTCGLEDSPQFAEVVTSWVKGQIHIQKLKVSVGFSKHLYFDEYPPGGLVELVGDGIIGKIAQASSSKQLQIFIGIGEELYGKAWYNSDGTGRRAVVLAPREASADDKGRLALGVILHELGHLMGAEHLDTRGVWSVMRSSLMELRWKQGEGYNFDLVSRREMGLCE